MTKEAASSDNLFANVLKNQDANTDTETSNAETPQQEAVTQPEDEAPKPDQLTLLKNRATLMGIQFSPKIGVDGLRAKIEEKLAKDSAEPQADPDEPDKAQNDQNDTDTTNQVSAVPVAKPVKKSLRQELYEREMKLVRLRITNLDPKKKDLPGEIFTFANEILGGVRKYIPYGEATDNGYHVPYCIYKQLRDREFVNIRTRKGTNGRVIVESGMAREFSLEVLPDLTQTDIARLAASQSAAGGLA